MLARIFEGLLFFSASLFCFAFFCALLVEAVAIWTGKLPTISELTHQAIEGHTVWSYSMVALTFLLIGALLVHFTGWRA